MQRRRVLMGMPHGFDTSPIILEYGKRLRPGPTTVEDSNYCITALYDYSIHDNNRRFIMFGNAASTLNFKNGVYFDYWNTSGETTETMAILATYGTTQLQFTLSISMLDQCYMINEYTGDILFAGKNSIYYGHRNISELN